VHNCEVSNCDFVKSSIGLQKALKGLPVPSKLFVWGLNAEMKRLREKGLHVTLDKAILFDKNLKILKEALYTPSVTQTPFWSREFETAVAKLSVFASGEYATESEFRAALWSDLSTALGVQLQTFRINNTVEIDLGHRDLYHPSIIIELKLGAGSGGGDAETQLIGYYLHSLKEVTEFDFERKRPTVLIAAVRNSWNVYGAVFLEDTVCFDKLGHLDLNDLHIACLQFSAIKGCIAQIAQNDDQTKHPWICSITNHVDKTTLQWSYTIKSRLHWKKNLFSVQIINSDGQPSTKAIVKFAKHYSVEAHQAAKNLAPTLFGYSQVFHFN